MVCVMLMVCVWRPSEATAARSGDFVSTYGRAKIMLRQKLYFDAVRDFTRAINTTRGRTHFGAHYFLAQAYFWLPDIQQANRYLTIAKGLARNNNQKAALVRLTKKIEALYGKLKLEPEVDPEEVGRLKIVLKPASPFSHKHKVRYSKILFKRLATIGLLLGGRSIYLPKGEYKITIKQPQCLVYGLLRGSNLAKAMTVSSQTTTLRVRAKRSCQCVGGQRIYKKNDKLFCACPEGLGWNKNEQRCEKAFNPIPWVIAGAGVLVVTGVVVTLVATAPDGTAYVTVGPTNTKSTVW
ncbi:MAG: hypothetical protein CL920_04225 [Deltaproteobacteria bacterium]|nr:hypothetical protein [Deltaproteobacteria bacterium]MBU47883.1 hypothetical protein [Deltaproteobacteria bacterium]